MDYVRSGKTQKKKIFQTTVAYLQKDSLTDACLMEEIEFVCWCMALLCTLQIAKTVEYL